GALRTGTGFSRIRRRRMYSAAVALAATLALAPRMASAEGLFDFLFGGGSQKQQQRPASGLAGFFADPFGINSSAPTPPRPVASASGGSGPAFCVRTCDGRYFPVQARGNATPAQMCQAFCPASQTAEFTPVASYPGLTSEVRARLGEMKVAPTSTETIADEAPSSETSRDVAPVTSVPKSSPSIRAKRADLD